MRLALSSAGLLPVWLLVLAFITLPSALLLSAIRIRARLIGKPLTSSPTHQPMDCLRGHDLDDFEPDDEWCQEWLSILTEDPITFINTAHHLDRCYAQPASKPSRTT